MARVSTYLTFTGSAEEAFNFYKSVFGTDFVGSITRMGDLPPGPGTSAPADGEKNLVVHVELPILAGHVLMASDLLESMGHVRRVGNDVTLNLELDDRGETERLFGLLSDGGSDVLDLAEMPWDAYWGTCADRCGVRWMFNCRQR